MHPQKSALFVVTSVVIAGCLACGTSKAVTSESPATTEVAVDNEFELAPGQAAAFAALGLTVRFYSVTNDSRCPRDVQCVWAGNAKVLVTLKRTGGVAYQSALNSFTDPKSVKDGNETLTLVSVLPETDTRHPITPGEYRARFVVHSGS